MDKSTMTIHRGLAELKLIDSRIEKAIQNIQPCSAQQKDKPINGTHSKEDFENKAKADLQSITDLITRKQTIKSAIVKANAETSVTIGDKSMTIAEAINYKTILEFKRQLARSLKSKGDSIVSHVNANNHQVEQNALKLAEAALQKDNVKIGDDDAGSIINPYMKSNEYHLLDPLNYQEKAAKLLEDVDTFETEVDAALSEINAITKIEI